MVVAQQKITSNDKAETFVYLYEKHRKNIKVV